MKRNFDRILSIATLAALLVAIVLLLKRPAPTTQLPQAPAANSTNASSQQTIGPPVTPAAPPAQPTQPLQAGSGDSPAPPPAHNTPAPQSQKLVPNLNSSEISAAISQLLGSSAAGLTPDSDIGAGMPNIKDQKVTYDGDMVHGQFLTEIGGKDVWITISGHMGQKDGYATFDPTEFKVGDLEVPVALVNPVLQKKLADERDRLKIAEPTK